MYGIYRGMEREDGFIEVWSDSLGVEEVVL